jgi:RNA polymerase sigma-70 factor, ECF subfamily
MSMESPADADRLTRWVREHGGAVRGFLLTSTGDPHAADDLLQETLARAWQARDRYRDDGKERAYLLRIADRVAADRRRKKGERLLDDETWRAVEPESDFQTPLEQLQRTEQERNLQAALDQLTDPQRRTLLLRFFGNLDFAEIGKQLGLPVNTVLSHGRRGLLALKKILLEKRT